MMWNNAQNLEKILKMPLKKLLLCGALSVAFTCSWAEPMQFSPDLKRVNPQNQHQLIDRVVVVVNHDVITEYQLQQRMRMVARQLTSQGTPLPEQQILRKQILERMVMDMLLRQYAEENGLKVDNQQLDLALSRIAQQNSFPTLAAFRQRLESEGVNFEDFREEIRSEIITTRIREREVESKLVISEAEVDNYLQNQSRMDKAGEEYRLAHILVVVPEQANTLQIQTARQHAQQALVQLQQGVSFAQVAAGMSDASDALKGGELGWRPVERIPPLFLGELSICNQGSIPRWCAVPMVFIF